MQFNFTPDCQPISDEDLAKVTRDLIPVLFNLFDPVPLDILLIAKLVMRVEEMRRGFLGDLRATERGDRADAPKLLMALDHYLAESDGITVWMPSEVAHALKHALQSFPTPAPEEQPAIYRALQLAYDHLDMEALQISHCKDAEIIERALLSAPKEAASQPQEGTADE